MSRKGNSHRNKKTKQNEQGFTAKSIQGRKEEGPTDLGELNFIFLTNTRILAVKVLGAIYSRI